MQMTDSKKRVHFVDQQQAKYTLPMKEKKLMPENGSLLIPTNQDIIYKDIKQNYPIQEVVRYKFTDEMDKLLNIVDQKQNQRLQMISNIVMQQNKENQDFISQLEQFKQQISFQRQVSSDQLKQQQKQVKSNRSSILMDENLKKRQSQFREKLQEEQSIRLQEAQNIRYSLKTNNENTNQITYYKQPNSNNNNLSQGQRYSILKQQESSLNDKVIYQHLESLGLYSDQSNIQVEFWKQEVQDFNEDQVEGYYFKVSKQSKLFYEFYLYRIENLEEIEYNPVKISNQLISINESNDLESTPQFFSILSFNTNQLVGFFQSFFQYVFTDRIQ